ncbi:hypothetical protein T09_8577 [Trichinella sp. T9]|nr:hypothetical protein T09_8577 [Trichinella sp. T9]
MALRSAQKGCNTPRFLSLSSPVDFMMKTTDFTLPIRLVFRIFRLWIHAVIETAMLYEKCTAMALRSAQKGCNTPRFWSFRSAVVFIMKTTDFTMKKCDFYDPSALTNLPLVAVFSLQLIRLLKILNLDYALCSGGIIPLPWDNLIMLGNEGVHLLRLFPY